MIYLDYIKETVDNGKYRASTGWLACKCPYCDQESSKTHFNILIKEGSPLVYHCFRASCGVKGVLNKKIARDLGLVNSTFLKFVQDNYNSNIYIEATKKSLHKKITNINLGKLSEECKEYFKKRTGHELTKQLQEKFRICSSIIEFIDNNKDNPKLNETDLKQKLWWLIQNESRSGMKFIYFFNERYTMVYGREICDEYGTNMKVKSSLIGNKDNILLEHVPYSFKGEGEYVYDSSHETEGTLFLAEGHFDIINSYLHLYKKYKGVFMATTSFAATKKHIDFFSKYVYKPDVVIISDDDIKPDYYTNYFIKRLNQNRVGNIYVVYNTEAKDMGEYKGKKFNITTDKIKG